MPSMNKQIKFYRANEVPYGLFSNFDRKHPIIIEGIVWASTEHFFQAMKFKGTDPFYFTSIWTAKTPADAAAMGRDRSHQLRPDWEQVKDDVMREAIRAKFTQHADMRGLLLNTSDAELIEHTPNDNYWADGGDGNGKNMLGKILMEIRAELKPKIT